MEDKKVNYVFRCNECKFQERIATEYSDDPASEIDNYLETALTSSGVHVGCGTKASS